MFGVIHKIHGVKLSPATQTVMVVAYEKDLNVDLIMCNFAVAEHKSAAWLEVHPFGQVPYLEEDDFKLYESRAISRYLATKYADQGTKLLPDPADLKAMALVDQFISVEMSNFFPSAGGITREAIFAPRFGGKTDPVALEKYHSDLKAKLDGFERILAKQNYLGGKEIGLADLYCLALGTRTESAFPDIFNDPAKPNVARWWNAISTRPSWKRVLEETK
ncbi:hypothetical protein FRB96_008915 [Tulasnella sp. 330]|nr:hypothetical protein FRB96_008915 [Tulasnella sp. 330]KAG8883204.1 hypothetical protein FRB97_007026 [Tulasnella sp. 331]